VSGPSVAVDRGQSVHGSKRMLRAVSWLLGSSVMSQVLRLVSSLILTRLLEPGAFGLVVTLQTVYLGLVLLSDLGVWQSVVNAPTDNDHRFLGTAWAVQLARAVLLATVILLAAGTLAFVQATWPQTLGGVYAHPQLPEMLAVFCIMALAQGLESIKLALAQRHLQTAMVARLELAGQLVGVFITIGLAFLGAGAWSLVVGSVSVAVARAALSHVWLPGRSPAPCWDAAHAQGLLHFGKWILLSSMIGFMAAHGEKLLLGGLLPPASVGLYAIAATLMSAIVAVISVLNGHFIFPALSSALREGEAAALAVYGRVQRVADWMLGLLAGALMMCGHWAVHLLYDERYVGADWMLKWLAAGLIGMRFQVLEQMMFAMSLPARVTVSNIARALALGLLVPAGFELQGLHGAMAAIVIAQFAGWPNAWHFRHSLGISWTATERTWPVALITGMALGWIADRSVAWLMALGHH
jgi:O-antigen/teichoic acid export membrane protein